MVIVIMGVIGGVVAVFMKGPIDAYLASGKRAALTDVADTTVRRIGRDLRRALPNSIRTSGSSCLEFIPTKTGGRYRAEGAGALTFSGTTAAFNMLGDYSNFAGAVLPTDQKIINSDLIVVYNLNLSDADAYPAAPNNNYSAVTGVGPYNAGTHETPIAIALKQFPFASPSSRFHVVSGSEQVVSYVCNGTNLYRTVSDLPAPAALCPFTGVRASVIASNVDCAAAATSFSYSGPDLMRNALVSMILTVQDSSGSESVRLQHEVHVDNTP